MKVYILFMAVILSVVQVKSDLHEDMRKANLACREETKVSEDELKSFFKGQLKEQPTEALKCHLKCFMEKQGQWKNGAFDEKSAIKYLQGIPSLKDHQDAINKSVDDCKTAKGSNDCDTAYLITKCFAEHKASMM